MGRMPPNKLAFSIRDATDITGLSRYAVARLVKSGDLKTAMVGQQPRITRASLVSLVQTFGGGAHPPTSEAA
jgi:hypothetical protein